MKNRPGLLMLCYYYPPIKSMGVMRSYALSHAWLNYFDSVSVITTDNNKRLESEIFSIDDRIEINAVSTFDYRTITSYFSNKSHYSESGKSSWFGRFAVKLLNSFPFNLWIGEGGAVYGSNVYRAAVEKIKTEKIGYIYSSFRPYSDHHVASRLKRRFPQLIWLADFRDIHVDILKNNVVFPSYQHRMNKKILKLADVVTTVSEGCADHIRTYVPSVNVIYNGVGQDNSDHETVLNELFTITYTGSLYGQMRNPSLVFQVIKDLKAAGCFLKPIQIVYAGKDADTWNNWIEQYDLQEYNQNKGQCSYNESRYLQQSSHINLQLTFSHPEVTGAITGKVMEYIQAGRPMLCLINGSKDQELESFFENVQGAQVAYHEGEYKLAVNKMIVYYYQKYLNGEIEHFNLDQPILKELSWDIIARKFVSIVDAV